MEDCQNLLVKCQLCPRACGVNRLAGEAGFCGATGSLAEVAHTMIHHWEEPCLAGTDPTRGSGTVFFAHCTLRCVYCQNQAISSRSIDPAKATHLRKMDAAQLSQVFLDLQAQGAHNINLVTPTQFLATILPALQQARRQGLAIPIVYNTSGYETVETVRRLKGLVDIYLCDLKYWTAQTGKAYSLAPDYVDAAWPALAEMVAQTGPCEFSENGMLQKGVIVRHLVLPGRAYAAKKIINRLYKLYQNNIIYSIMNQYTPLPRNPGIQAFPELLSPTTPETYNEVADFAATLDLSHAYIQTGEAISESFIPIW